MQSNGVKYWMSIQSYQNVLPLIQDNLIRNMWTLHLILIFSVLLIFFLIFFENFVRKNRTSYLIILFVFTIFESFLIAALSAICEKDRVLTSVGVTCVIITVMIIFSYQTKFDLSGYGTYIFVFIITFILGILAIYFRDNIMTALYTSLGASLFSVYLIIDTRFMIEGNCSFMQKKKEKYSNTLIIRLLLRFSKQFYLI